MSKLPIKRAIKKVTEMLDILQPLEEVEKRRIIEAYNQGRKDCQHERPIKDYNAEKYYEHLQNLH